ncbi:MAG TPA: sugar phosphate isomerase/epimerase family protein [Tepidisphaeraceae bacterium]|nr:sugar phosphate isomerase/epimerase family protein [Tepidisphaeraceae bacterium]
MYKTLSPGAIGVTVGGLHEGLVAAKIGGFDGLEVSAGALADEVELHGADKVKRLFAEHGIRPAAFPLPTDWRNGEQAWERDLALLPRLARAAAAVGITRTFTWILPGSNDRPADLNRAFHVGRFEPIARILEDQGVSLGLEFIGPKTLRDSFAHPFIHTMDDMLSMARQIGPNVGVLLDCWHWYTSVGTLEDIRRLRPRDVVYVHVNDAPAGVAVDEQVDNVRDLPGATGVIDITGFLRALERIGYDGPVTPEPFKKDLAALPNDEARLRAVGASMDKIFRGAGI